MELIVTVLFGIGAVFLLGALLVLLLKKKQEIPLWVGLLLMLGSISVGGSVLLMMPSVQSKLLVTSEKPFHATDTRLPRVRMVHGTPLYLDADGTKTYGKFMVTASGARAYLNPIDGVYVELPDKGQRKSKDRYYRRYGYEVSSTGEIIYESVGRAHYASELDTYMKGFSESRVTKVKANSSERLRYIDYIFKKKLPISWPKNTVSGEWMVGTWRTSESGFLALDVPKWELTVDADSTVLVKSKYVQGTPGFVPYALEPLGKQAYKLYIRSDSGGSNGVDQEVFPRTFLLYRTGPATMLVVFYDDQLVRRSLEVSRE